MRVSQRLAFYTLVGVLMLTGQVASSQTSTPFPHARTVEDGEVWMSWDNSRRTGYVEGYIAASAKAREGGCEDAFRICSEELRLRKSHDPIGECYNSGDRYGKAAFAYVGAITDFYQRYRDDRGIPLPQLMYFLSDSKNETLEEIHVWYLSVLARAKQK